MRKPGDRPGDTAGVNRSMFIVFDSCIWFSELALNSNLGAAVRFFIRKNGAKVAVPEVVRLETEHNLRNRMNEFIDNIRTNHRQLLTVFGKLKEMVLPEASAVEDKIASIFNDIGVEIKEIPFSFESARLLSEDGQERSPKPQSSTI